MKCLLSISYVSVTYKIVSPHDVLTLQLCQLFHFIVKLTFGLLKATSRIMGWCSFMHNVFLTILKDVRIEILHFYYTGLKYKEERKRIDNRNLNTKTTQ